MLGEDDANALMTEFPSVEAGELVTKDFLRAELAEQIGGLRVEMAERMRQQTVWLVGSVVAASAAVSAIAQLG